MCCTLNLAKILTFNLQREREFDVLINDFMQPPDSAREEENIYRFIKIEKPKGMKIQRKLLTL